LKNLLIVVLSIVLLIFIGVWRRTKRDLLDYQRRPSPDVFEDLDRGTDRAWLTMFSTLGSITRFPPFSDSPYGERNARGEQMISDLRDVVTTRHELEPDLPPLRRAQAVLHLYDDILERYATEIEAAYTAMMTHYEHRPLPRRNQDGFDYDRLW